MRRAEKIYRALLLLLPKRFRHEARSELLEVFRDGWSATQRPLGRLRFWTRTLADLVVTAVSERTARARRFARHPPRERPMDPAAPGRRLTGELHAGMRRMLRHPGRTLSAAGVLGLGVAAIVLVLVLVRDIVRRPLPFDAPDRLVHLNEVGQGRCCYWPSFPNIRDWREHAGAVLDGVIAAAPPEERPILLADRPVRALTGGVSRGFFRVLGIAPLLGRDFAPTENAPGGEAVAIVSWRFWANELGGRPLERLGFTLGEERFQVVGVLPRDFRFLGVGGAWQDVAVWTPLERNRNLGGRTSHGYHVVGRLADGVDLARARVEMDRLATTLKEAHGEPTQADQIRVTLLIDDVVGPLRKPLRILLIAAVGVLLVACMNLAVALVAQGLGRVRELGIRVALGASHARLVRQMIIESLLVGVPASCAGLTAAWIGLTLLRKETAGTLPRLDQVGIDGVDAALAVGLALVAAVLTGLVPAMMSATRHARSPRVGSAWIRQEGRVLWRSFVAGQTALTMPLLVGCGLLLRSFVEATSVDLGYDPTNVLAVDVTLPAGLYQDPARRVAFYEQALGDVRALPRVLDAGLTSIQPFATSAMVGTVARSGREERVRAAFRYVDTGYFPALGIPLLRGEKVRVADPDETQVVLDAGLASRLWPDGEAIGGALEWPSRVVGVVGSVREWHDDQGVGTIYVDWRTSPAQLLHMYLMIRHDGSAVEVAHQIRTALRAIDPMVPIEVQPLSALVREQLSDCHVLLLVALLFACVATTLSAAGVYAVVSFATRRRRREAAIRLSMGAQEREVGRMMMGQGMRPSVQGILVGLVGAWPTGTALRAQLFQVNPFDPFVLASAGAFLLAAGTLAAWIPSRIAARVEPASALQTE